jgi:hypothetical protein
LNARVLVVGIEEKEKTTGAIIIPDKAREKPQEGKIAAIGPGKWNENGSHWESKRVISEDLGVELVSIKLQPKALLWTRITRRSLTGVATARPWRGV